MPDTLNYIVTYDHLTVKHSDWLVMKEEFYFGPNHAKLLHK